MLDLREQRPQRLGRAPHRRDPTPQRRVHQRRGGGLETVVPQRQGLQFTLLQEALHMDGWM